jgi:murein DD-endopeptidase MepM/ murein hydrolase activator NlpD
VPRSFSPKRKQRRKAELRNTVRLGVVLTALTAINVYVFFVRPDRAVQQAMQPSSTGKPLVEQKSEALAAAELAAAKSRALKVAEGTTIAEAQAAAGGKVVEGKIGNKDTLLTVLEREGFSAVAMNVVGALSKVFDPKLVRPGDVYVLTFDDDGSPESFEYAPSPALRYIAAIGPDGAWTGRKEEKPVEIRVEQAAGVIDSSLYESIQKSGESSALAALLVDLFAWDINFYVDTHPQDHWKVIVEKQYLGGQFYKYGHILAAEYGGKAGTYRAFYWDPGSGGGGGGGKARYYDERGQSVAKTMLKSPLRFVRISSKFDRKRFHPVLHRTKAHLGIDYAAPTGTPVWASMGGKVVECQMKRGSGNTVVINHGGGLSTRYYHLSRFAKGLKAGQQVRQKQTIGYVGTTGLSTGPHLHFSVVKNGVFVDPSKMTPTREASVPNRAAFLAAIKGRVAQLKALPAVVAKN